MIRFAKNSDLDSIEEVVKIAKKYMNDTGNTNQWIGTYPSREVFQDDIEGKHLYVCENEEGIYAVFAFILGEEPNYSYIEDGNWLNREPYGTIHRIASNGKVKGVFKECADFCKKMTGNVRVDTHHDNHTMQHVIEKNGFQKCGIIYMRNHAKRIAYQCVETKETSGDL